MDLADYGLNIVASLREYFNECRATMFLDSNKYRTSKIISCRPTMRNVYSTIRSKCLFFSNILLEYSSIFSASHEGNVREDSEMW